MFESASIILQASSNSVYISLLYTVLYLGRPSSLPSASASSSPLSARPPSSSGRQSASSPVLDEFGLRRHYRHWGLAPHPRMFSKCTAQGTKDTYASGRHMFTPGAYPYSRYKGTGCSNDWGGRGYDDSVPGEVTETAPSRDRTK